MSRRRTIRDEAGGTCRERPSGPVVKGVARSRRVGRLPLARFAFRGIRVRSRKRASNFRHSEINQPLAACPSVFAFDFDKTAVRPDLKRRQSTSTDRDTALDVEVPWHRVIFPPESLLSTRFPVRCTVFAQAV